MAFTERQRLNNYIKRIKKRHSRIQNKFRSLKMPVNILPFIIWLHAILRNIHVKMNSLLIDSTTPTSDMYRCVYILYKKNCIFRLLNRLLQWFMAALKTGHPWTFFSFLFYSTYKFISEEVFRIIFDIKYCSILWISYCTKIPIQIVAWKQQKKRCVWEWKGRKRAKEEEGNEWKEEKKILQLSEN